MIVSQRNGNNKRLWINELLIILIEWSSQKYISPPLSEKSATLPSSLGNLSSPSGITTKLRMKSFNHLSTVTTTKKMNRNTKVHWSPHRRELPHRIITFSSINNQILNFSQSPKYKLETEISSRKNQSH